MSNSGQSKILVHPVCFWFCKTSFCPNVILSQQFHAQASDGEATSEGARQAAPLSGNGISRGKSTGMLSRLG